MANKVTDLLSDRARLSKLETFKSEDQGSSFLGSKDFPPSLVNSCRKWDPMGIFKASATAGSTPWGRIVGKKFLVCTGEIDKLTPPRCSQPFMEIFKDAAAKNPKL